MLSLRQPYRLDNALHGRSGRCAAGRVISNRAGIKWVIVRSHPSAEALHGGVKGLVDWEGVNVPGIARPTMATMTTISVTVAMISITSMS